MDVSQIDQHFRAKMFRAVTKSPNLLANTLDQRSRCVNAFICSHCCRKPKDAFFLTRVTRRAETDDTNAHQCIAITNNQSCLQRLSHAMHSCSMSTSDHPTNLLMMCILLSTSQSCSLPIMLTTTAPHAQVDSSHKFQTKALV